tara:strand:+ start:323 stop:538 length:216 start_codon:yes stop_codon:yes gene_type:complete
MDGQFFNIKIKSSWIDWTQGRPPSFYLWAKDKEDLKRILRDKKIKPNQIESIIEKGSDWNDILKKEKDADI